MNASSNHTCETWGMCPDTSKVWGVDQSISSGCWLGSIIVGEITGGQSRSITAF